MSFALLCTIGFIFGIGFGFCVQRAGLCFAHGLGEVYMGKGKRILRLFFVIFLITTSGFFVSSLFSPQLGLKPIGEIRGYGFFNLLSGMFFGAGILLNGGCILGTLRQIGEGNMNFLLVLIAFIPGMALIVYGVNPWLTPQYHPEKLLLHDLLGISPVWLVLLLLLAAAGGLYSVMHVKKKD